MVPWQGFVGQGKFSDDLGSCRLCTAFVAPVLPDPPPGPLRDLLPRGGLYTFIPCLGRRKGDSPIFAAVKLFRMAMSLAP